MVKVYDSNLSIQVSTFLFLNLPEGCLFECFINGEYDKDKIIVGKLFCQNINSS